jgi:hypothetical protein
MAAEPAPPRQAPFQIRRVDASGSIAGLEAQRGEQVLLVTLPPMLQPAEIQRAAQGWAEELARSAEERRPGAEAQAARLARRLHLDPERARGLVGAAMRGAAEAAREAPRDPSEALRLLAEALREAGGHAASLPAAARGSDAAPGWEPPEPPGPDGPGAPAPSAVAGSLRGGPSEAARRQARAAEAARSAVRPFVADLARAARAGSTRIVAWPRQTRREEGGPGAGGP